MHFQVKIILKSNHSNTPNFSGHKVGVSIKMMIKMILIQTKKKYKEVNPNLKTMHINSLI
jgi:hypothetical protein